MTATNSNSGVVRALAAAQRIVSLVSRNDFPVVQVIADTRLKMRVTTADLIAAAAHDKGASLMAVVDVLLDTSPTDRSMWNAAARQLIDEFEAAGIEVTYR